MSENFNGLLSDEEIEFLKLYEDDMDAIPALPVEERKKYIAAAKKGDEDARGILIQDFMCSVVDVARMYAGQGVLLQDLIGEGNLFLVQFFKDIPSEADENNLETVVTEGLVKVYDELIKAASDEEKEQEKIIKKTEKVAAAAKALSAELGRKVTADELAEKTKISKKQIIDALKNTANKIEGLESDF